MDCSHQFPSPSSWYVLHVKPRTEKKVVAYLASYGFFRYLPVYVKVTKVQRRKVRTELPLFPGYVFTRLDADGRLKMLRTNLLVRTIPVARPREMIHKLRQIAVDRPHRDLRHSFLGGKVDFLRRLMVAGRRYDVQHQRLLFCIQVRSLRKLRSRMLLNHIISDNPAYCKQNLGESRIF